MGKNRKAKQVAESTDVQLSEEECSSPDAPIEFLTNDDFCVVVPRKRRHSRKTSEESLDKEPLTRSSPTKITPTKESHSSFWAVRSKNSLNVLTTSKVNFECASSNDEDRFSGDCPFSSVMNNQESGEPMAAEHTLNECSVPGNKAFEVGGNSVAGLDSKQIPAAHAVFKSVQNCLKMDESMQDVLVKPLEDNKAILDDASGGIAFESNKENSSSELKPERAMPAPKKKQKKLKKKANSEPASGKSHSSSNSESLDVSGSESSSVSERSGKGARIKRKGPSKKQIEALREAMRQFNDQEEKLLKEGEIQRQKVEEAATQLEQGKLNEKDKTLEVVKQRRGKKHAGSKCSTKSQKQARARTVASLEILRQQGVDIPQIGEKRPRGPPIETLKSAHRRRCYSTPSESDSVCTSHRLKSQSLSSQESSSCKDSVSDLPSSLESLPDSPTKEHWDLTFPDHLNEGLSENSVQRNVIDDANLQETLSAKSFKSLQPKKPVKLRSPIVCVLGHVDTGKTKILDYIRKTHVQDSEAGGITQQIGATMIPQEALKEKCKMVKDFSSLEIETPGLLVIDTPGHESFRNLRSRGTSICDIAILVVDVMHGLEPQTLESIELLRKNKTPFVVALNKIDKLYGWESMNMDVESLINKQNQLTSHLFEKKCQEIIAEFAQVYLNASLYYKNSDPRSFVSMVPTSAITGDGMGNLLALVTTLTQSMMYKKLVFTEDLEATTLEVKVIPGLGTTLDVILVNGRLQEGDTIVLAGYEGPIVTQIRSLLMPHPLKELRVKNTYVEYKTLEGAQGVKITGKDLDKTLAGLPLFVARTQDELEEKENEMVEILDHYVNSIKTSDRGVYVLASTLGSLEALLEYLTKMSIPYVACKIGPVVKRDVMKASVMLEHDSMYAAIMAFDVKVEKDAQELADNLGVKIFHAKIIYHLADEFIKLRGDYEKERAALRSQIVFPCMAKIITVISSKAVVTLVVEIVEGSLRINAPLIVYKKKMYIGVVTAIEVNQHHVSCAKPGEVARITLEKKNDGIHKDMADKSEVPKKSKGSKKEKETTDKLKLIDYFSINQGSNECNESDDDDLVVFSNSEDALATKVVRNYIDESDYLITFVTRESIKLSKEHFHDEFTADDWDLIDEIRKILYGNAGIVDGDE